MTDLVLNLTANASNFAAGMKSAQKAANSLFLDTRTNLEKFQMGLEKIQAMKAAGFINQDTAERAQHNLSKQLDPFGVIAQNQARAKADAERVASNQKTTQSIIASERAAAQRMLSDRASADAQAKSMATSKAEYQRKVAEGAAQMEWEHLKKIEADRRVSAAAQAKYASEQLSTAKQTTAGIIASERAAATQMVSIRNAADAQAKVLVESKAEYQRRVIEGSKQMEWDYLKQLEVANRRQVDAQNKAAAEQLRIAQQKTQGIIASERAAAQIMVRTQEQASLRVAAIKERLAERIGRANMQQTIAEAHLTGGSAGIGGNRAMIIQQLAFAAEDAATQFGTRGLAGAVMAAGNNLTFAASMMGPMIGVMSSVGLTAAMLAMTYFKVGNSAKKAAEETKTLKEETEKLGAIIKARREFVESIKEGGSEQNRDRLKSLKGELSDEEKLLIVSAGKTSRARLEILQAESRARKKNEETNAVTFMAGPGAIVIPVKANENAIKQDQAVVAARKKYIEVLAEETRLKAKIGVINSRSEDIEKRLLELRKANRESLQTGIWQARQDEIKKSEESAKNIRMQNPAFRFNEELKELDKLKEAKVLSEAEYQAERMRMEKDAVEQIRSQQKQNSQMKLTSAVDIRSAEAGSVIANAFAKAMSPQSDDPKALLMQQLKALNLIADRQKEIAAINNKQLGQQMKTGGNVELQMVN